MRPENYYNNLQVPKGLIDVVIDTDTYNEIDDQFAIAYLLASSDKLNLKALYAAPFLNHHSESPKDGMLKSYEEIHRLLELTNRQQYIPVTYKGSEGYLPDEKTPVISDAAENLVKLAMQYTEEKPLYVVATGAITNVASALLMEPKIADRMVVSWIGGHSKEFFDDNEFNMLQDVAAARVLFRSGVPVVQLPCMGVVSSFTISYVELEHHLAGKNALCDFLVNKVKEEITLIPTGMASSRAIWDVTAVAWLLNDNDRFMLSRLDHLPVPEYDHKHAYDRSRLSRYIYFIWRDALAEDLLRKLAEFK